MASRRGCSRSAGSTNAGATETVRRGAALSSSLLSMKAHERTKAPRVATRILGSFFGHDGVLETAALEMMRASGPAEPMLSRALASRNLAR